MRAAAWGAIAGAAPDLDILFSLTGDPFDQLQTHRGITHSLFFAPVIGPLWGWLLDRRERARSRQPPYRDRLPGSESTPDSGNLLAWIGVITLALWSHPWLDYFTPYGTQLLLPFSNARFSLPVMPIIDPIYTALLVAGLVGAWFLRRRPAARWASLVGLLASSAYIGASVQLNEEARQVAERELRAAGVNDAVVHAFPTVLQIHNRRLVARSPDADRVGYLSTWTPCPIEWAIAPRLDDPRIDVLLETREGGIFEWFAMGMTHRVLEPQANGSAQAALADLRYGTDLDPRRSIFGISALFDAAGTLRGPPVLETFRPSPGDAGLMARVFSAYAACVVPGAR